MKEAGELLEVSVFVKEIDFLVCVSVLERLEGVCLLLYSYICIYVVQQSSSSADAVLMMWLRQAMCDIR